MLASIDDDSAPRDEFGDCAKREIGTSVETKSFSFRLKSRRAAGQGNGAEGHHLRNTRIFAHRGNLTCANRKIPEHDLRAWRGELLGGNGIQIGHRTEINQAG